VTLTVNQRIRLKITRQFVVAGIFVGIIYIYNEWGISEPWHYIVGVVVGILIGLLLAILELFVFARGAKRLKFIWLLAMRTVLYFLVITFIIFNVAVIAQMVIHKLGYLETIGAEYIQEYVFEGRFLTAVLASLLFAFSVNFVRMVSRKMGQGMLASYIQGTYYSPVHQARIIMFVKVVDAKKIMLELGPKRLHEFLNDLFYDYTSPIVNNRGIIYEYIEDLTVITWSIDKGLRKANCIRTYFDIQESINNNKEKYLEKYGFIPRIEAGLHTGSVVRAEIGEVKTQIVFHGDTMNTTARILDKCRELKLSLMASDQLIRMIGLPRIYSKKSVGEIELRGKQDPLKLFEVLDKVREGEK
jgi:adenylate cyclase